jgi:uncharacterized membrane protein YphA (DoxX/SURF4 family)
MNAAYWSLRIMLGLGVLIAGADKFANLLANWESYLSPYVTSNLPIPAAQFMQIIGIIEIVVGICILSGLSRVFGYIGMIWLWGIAVNLITTHMFYDVAVRDILLGSAAYGLARLTEARAAAMVSPQRDEFWRAA